MMTRFAAEVPRILFVSTPAFHSSLDWPLPRSASIQGISEPASGTPNCVASMPVRWCARTLRSISRMADAGSSSSVLTSALRRAELVQQFTHVARPAAGGRLVRHGRAPLDEVVLEQPAQAHQHAGHGAVAADVVLDPAGEAGVDDVPVDGVQHDDGVLIHAQRGGGIDPEAVPAAAAELAVDLLGVVPALGGDNNGQLRQRLEVERVLELAGGARGSAGNGRGGTARVRGGEEDRVDVGEVALVLHALHQDGTDHATPTDQADGRGSCCSHGPSLDFTGSGRRSRLRHAVMRQFAARLLPAVPPCAGAARRPPRT